MKWLGLTVGLWSGGVGAAAWAIESASITPGSALQLAQVLPPPQDLDPSPQEEPFEELTPLPTLPPVEDLLGPQPAVPDEELGITTDETTVVIERFEVEGSTVFSEVELAAVTAPYTQRPLTFTEILQARSAVTQLYVDNGYVTSGAIFPPQQLQNGVATIQVIEGRLEQISVSGTRRLSPDYISSRLGIGATSPLNVNRLLERLQLLQLDPLIESISADLQAGTQPGTNLLVVSVIEADSFDVTYTLDNNRSPSVGSVRHQLQAEERNLLGLGDSLRLGYSTTEGSDGIDLAYTLPLNPRGGTARFTFSSTDSRVIEVPFDILEIEAESRFYELTLRQPVVQKPTQEVALGLTLSHQQ
ncbi:ShlB/FhaC/HecB family hemolysin secretion/activation protein, partial [Sphaerothrix gracilis]|uniref:ShlB/FhaC/HecB family hemolysin secretion/activation protein n=1 Tax=Sphaerothrix gracilis TaxID=3151835 RepID=UPI0031FCD9EB